MTRQITKNWLQLYLEKEQEDICIKNSLKGDCISKAEIGISLNLIAHSVTLWLYINTELEFNEDKVAILSVVILPTSCAFSPFQFFST